MQKDQNTRYVSSGGGVPDAEQIISVPVVGGHQWVITKNTPADPVGVVDLTVFFRCVDQSDPTLFDEPLRVATFPAQPGISKAYTWGELKGTKTYRNHQGQSKSQDVRSVVIIQFYPIREVNLGSGGDKTPNNANSAKQVVLDIAEVCEI